MSLRHPAVLGTATIRRTGGINQDGDPLPAVDHPEPDCWWAPQQGSEERTDARDTVVAGYWFGGPYDADVRATDKVLLPDLLDDLGNPLVWEVHGEVGRWKSPHRGGAKVGFHCALRRVTG